MYKLILKTLVLNLFSFFIFVENLSFADEQTQIKQYETGGIYEGEFLEGKQHGKGKYSLPNGYQYEGDWKEGKIEGFGKATYPDGSFYEGTFIDGQHSGEGKIIFPDGSF